MTQPSLGAFHVLDVFVERAAGGFVGRGCPGFAAAGQFVGGEVERDRVRFGVDRDAVAVFARARSGRRLGFGRDVADDEAGGAAGEAAVGDEGDIFFQAGADDRAGGREHFGHAGAALRAFVANDDDVALLDLCCCMAASMSSSESKQLAVPVNLQAFLAGDFGDGAVGAEVAAHDADVAGLLDRVRDRLHDVLPFSKVRQRGEVFGDSLAGDREAIAGDQPSSSSIFMTAGVPPTRCKSSCTYLPLGRRSAR